MRVGLVLVLLGIASYVITGARSVTALIPTVLGAVLILCGVIATRRRELRTVVLPLAIAVAPLGFLATATALGQVGTLLSGPARPALVARASMAAVLLVYLMVATIASLRGALSGSRS